MTELNAGAPASVPGLPQPGARVGSYVIERLAGMGGMSAVFEARHGELDKRVALKMLLPHYASHGEMARRFAREGAAAARLNHPHAVDVTDVGRDDTGAPFLVMEYLDGEELAALLERAGKLSVEQAADILVPVVAALATAHELGIVHRDLKPQNIMLAQRRHELVPKVVDFGISKVLEESMQLTGTEALLGTPRYMSPEQASAAGKVDARSDQFAVGTVLYECVVGESPFDAPSFFAVLTQVVECKYTMPRKLVPTLPKALEAVIVRALRKDPKARFADMRELGAALLPFASMRVQLSYAREFGPDPAAAPVRGNIEPSTASAKDRADKDSLAVSAVVAISQTVTAARTWLRGSTPSRAWRIAALSAVVLGVALPVALIATRDRAPHGHIPVPAPVPAPEALHERPAPEVSQDGPDKAVKKTEPREETAENARATYPINLTVEPSSAWLSLDGKPAGSGKLRRTLPADGVEHELLVGARGYKMRTLRFKDAPPPDTLVLEKLPERSPPPKPAPIKGNNDAPILR